MLSEVISSKSRQNKQKFQKNLGFQHLDQPVRVLEKK